MKPKQSKTKTRTKAGRTASLRCDALVRHPGLYRAKLSCRIGRDAIEGKTPLPEGCTPIEYALFNLLHAIEEIADALLPNNGHEPRGSQSL
jgi:hypothetical protein